MSELYPVTRKASQQLISEHYPEIYPIPKKISQQMKLMSYRQLIGEQTKFARSGEPSSYEHRLKALRSLRNLLCNGREQFLDAVYKDLRRDRLTTDFVEINTCLIEIDYFIDNLKDWMKPEYAEGTLATCMDVLYTTREPYGTALLIGPFNYPIFLIILPLIALIAAELTPHCAHVFDRLFTEVFDKKFIAVVQANAAGTIELMKERFDIAMFTGSTMVGRAIMKSASEHLTPVVLELGGKCPALVEDDADMMVTAKRIIWGKFLNASQTCIAPDYLIMSQKTRKLLFDSLVQVLHEFYGKNAKESPDYSRIVNERHFDRIATLLKQTNGMTLYSGGKMDRSDLYIPPTIIEVDDEKDVLMTNEIFGPILPIYIVEDFDDAIEFLRYRESPISTYIFTRSNEKVNRLVRETKSGNVVVNDVIMNFTVDTLPFGGIGQSGMGQYRGKAGFDTFSHRKSVMKRGFALDGLMSARYPPMTPAKHRTLLSLTTRRAMPKTFKSLFNYLPLILIGILLHYRFGGQKLFLNR